MNILQIVFWWYFLFMKWLIETLTLMKTSSSICFLFFFCRYPRIWRNTTLGHLLLNSVLTNQIVCSIPYLHDLEVILIQSVESLRASNINFCPVSSLLIAKDTRTCATNSPSDIIFVCNSKLKFLTLAMIWLANIPHSCSQIKVQQDVTCMKRSSSDSCIATIDK